MNSPNTVWPATLETDGWLLRRATGSDLGRLVALQCAAYAPNREILGVVPIPMQADYKVVLATMEVWLAEAGNQLDGALILEPRHNHLLIWSIATDPAQERHGLGNRLLAAAEQRARDIGLTTIRLYTGTLLVQRVAWYGRHGYEIEWIEVRADRSVTHMVKALQPQTPSV